ncbi:MAG: 5-(carboxyamino)imidazole ribonucleotide synthase [Chitinophagales bacterium]
MSFFPKLGILGGGQLGKMLIQAANPLSIPIHILDPNANCPAAEWTPNLTVGDFRDYDAVYQFGQTVDVLTIEIEQVNIEALLQLEKEGKTVHPNPAKIQIIQDKGLQKDFFKQHKIATSDYQVFPNKDAVLAAIEAGELQLPFVQKLRQFGYDGRGVQVIRTKADLDGLFEEPSLVEDLVDIDKELSVVVTKGKSGEIVCFDAVEMEFNPKANLVEFLFAPADISARIAEKAQELAIEVSKAFDIQGLLAVELFLTKSGKVLVNEVAPRPHNSGHHSIEACYTSQYQQHLRSVLDLPLGNTALKMPAVMVNLLGEPNHTGTAIYEGLTECLEMKGVYVHLYGKEITKPFRKMGHITILDSDLETAKKKAREVLDLLKVVS